MIEIVWFSNNQATPIIYFKLCTVGLPREALMVIYKFREIIENNEGIGNPDRDFRFKIEGSEELTFFQLLVKNDAKRIEIVDGGEYWLYDWDFFFVPNEFLKDEYGIE